MSVLCEFVKMFPHLATSILMLGDWTHLVVCTLMLSIRVLQSPNMSWNITPYTHFWIGLLTSLFMVMFQLMRIFVRTNYRCVQSPNISLDVAKWGQKFHKYTQYSHYLSVIKNDLSWLNNLFMVRFQLKRMPSYAKNKLLDVFSHPTSL